MAGPSDTISELQDQIQLLQQQLAEREQALAEANQQLKTLRSVIDYLPYAVYWKDRNLVYQGCNRFFSNDVQIPTNEIAGITDYDLPWSDQERDAFMAIEHHVMETGQADYNDQEFVIHANGEQEWFDTYKIPLCDEAGNVTGLLCSYTNITARKQAEATVQAQANLLQELSTPIIPVSDDILVMPLIGAMDSHRAQMVMESALEHLTNSHATIILLDLTGIAIIDTQVAHALIQTAKAVQLLGANLVLTGIRPEVAQSLVGLGVDLSSIITHSTLQHGLAEIYRQRSKRRTI